MKTHTCLVWHRPDRIHGSSILKLSGMSASVGIDVRVVDLAEAFAHHSHLGAVGVVDQTGRCRGLVTRTNFLGLLAKPFGREVLARKQVADVLETARSFGMHENIYAVSRELGEHLDEGHNRWFALTGGNGEFRGLFSSRDLVAHLARINQDDIQLASALQERMIRSQETWNGDGWQAMSFCRPALGVGGDFYYYRDLGQGRHFFALGDVSGKGVAASMLTSLLWGILRSWNYALGLKALLDHINRSLLETFQLEKYLTGIFMVYNQHKQELHFADMGHGHGALSRGKRIRTLQPPDLNLPLGIEPKLQPKLYRLQLKPGDLVTLWTDGITEQENAAEGEFGEERLHQLVLAQRKSLAKLPLQVCRTIDDWRGPIPQHDDMTWLQLAMDPA